MVCGDHGNFLDIAEVIRRLELTILKGGMENHSGSTWARFIVEVCSLPYLPFNCQIRPSKTYLKMESIFLLDYISVNRFQEVSTD